MYHFQPANSNLNQPQVTYHWVPGQDQNQNPMLPHMMMINQPPQNQMFVQQAPSFGNIY